MESLVYIRGALNKSNLCKRTISNLIVFKMETKGRGNENETRTQKYLTITEKQKGKLYCCTILENIL